MVFTSRTPFSYGNTERLSLSQIIPKYTLFRWLHNNRKSRVHNTIYHVYSFLLISLQLYRQSFLKQGKSRFLFMIKELKVSSRPSPCRCLRYPSKFATMISWYSRKRVHHWHISARLLRLPQSYYAYLLRLALNNILFAVLHSHKTRLFLFQWVLLLICTNFILFSLIINSIFIFSDKCKVLYFIITNILIVFVVLN